MSVHDTIGRCVVCDARSPMQGPFGGAPDGWSWSLRTRGADHRPVLLCSPECALRHGESAESVALMWPPAPAEQRVSEMERELGDWRFAAKALLGTADATREAFDQELTRIVSENTTLRHRLGVGFLEPIDPDPVVAERSRIVARLRARADQEEDKGYAEVKRKAHSFAGQHLYAATVLRAEADALEATPARPPAMDPETPG